MTKRHSLLTVTLVLLVFFLLGIRATVKDDANEKVTRKYFSELREFQLHMMDMQQALTSDQSVDSLQHLFKKARLSYKKVELFLEYYFPHYMYQLNPPAIQSFEQHSAPQGMQVIEEIIFPEYDPADKNKLLGNLYKINSSIQGLTGFDSIFKVDQNLPDAVMEELYRILALGITGFDSPISQQSIPEAAASVSSVRETLELIGNRFTSDGRGRYDESLRLLKEAEKYCLEYPAFETFDRMHFIQHFLNPVTAWLGEEKLRMGLYDKAKVSRLPLNPSIYKYYSLFDQRLVSPHFFTKDSAVASPELILLGKQLFFDPFLAGNNQRSCASCHNPAMGFTDGMSKSLAIDGHKQIPRNAPTLWNSAIQRDLFYDHRQRIMENLIIEVLANKDEMNSSAEQVAEKLSQREDYAKLYRNAYSDMEFSGIRVATAIASYVRTLISMNSRFDEHMRGHKGKLTPEEIQGFNIFMGKGKCGTCHFAPVFNGSKPPLFSFMESEVIGVPSNPDTVNASLDPDNGRVTISRSEVHEFAFKTPTVRNIELTAPYMHNGVYRTLEEVVDFYNKGGGVGLGIDLPNQTLPFDKLNLTEPEKKSLVSFLKSLTDTSVLARTY